MCASAPAAADLAVRTTAAAQLVRTFNDDKPFVITGRPGLDTPIVVSDRPPISAAVEAGMHLAVLSATNRELVMAALEVWTAHPTVSLSFASGGAFVFVHPTAGAEKLRQLAFFMEGALVDEPLLAEIAAAGRDFDWFVKWSGYASYRYAIRRV